MLLQLQFDSAALLTQLAVSGTCWLRRRGGMLQQGDASAGQGKAR